MRVRAGAFNRKYFNIVKAILLDHVRYQHLDDARKLFTGLRNFESDVVESRNLLEFLAEKGVVRVVATSARSLGVADPTVAV